MKIPQSGSVDGERRLLVEEGWERGPWKQESNHKAEQSSHAKLKAVMAASFLRLVPFASAALARHITWAPRKLEVVLQQ